MITCPPDFTSFSAPHGLAERFYAMTASPGKNFEEEAHELLTRYQDLTPRENSEFMLRFHLSDITTQAPVLKSLLGERAAFVSMVGQPPANGARIALEAWQIDSGRGGHLSGGQLGCKMNLKLRNYRLLFTRSHLLKTRGSDSQMREEFNSLLNVVAKEGGSLKDNVHRTWIYCRDIDNNYGGLVEARKELFREQGLTKDTHFITSTGIEGQSEHPHRLVSMDALSVFGLREGQVEYMAAPRNLSPTHVYGVTFERGVRLIYGDRSAYYISGTASIDHHGDVVHPGDVRKQTKRTLENISALMKNHDGELSDLKQAVVYLRDSADRETVARVIENSELSGVPCIMLKASVCRPSWLVEIDAIGVNDKGNARFADFI